MALIAHSLQFLLLLRFEVAARIGILAVALPALRQLIILALMKAVDLLVEIGSQLAAWIWNLRPTSGKRDRQRKQEGPKYEGMLYP